MSDPNYPPNCEICPIINEPSDMDKDFRIHEGDAWRLTLRQNQALLGTTFITLKEHKESLPELTQAEEEEFIAVRNRLYGAVGLAFAPNVINISNLMNLAFNPDDPDFEAHPHVHWHVKPRYKDPVRLEGQTFADPEFGQYLRKGRVHNVSLEMGRLIAGRIREHF